MTLVITSEHAERLARDLAALTGESIDEAVEASLAARLAAERRRRRVVSVDDIVERFAALPNLDERSADEVLGYPIHGPRSKRPR